MNRFTLAIHNKGWTVTKACEYWGIHYDTYNKRCNNPKMHNQLESMCYGLKQAPMFNEDDIATILDVRESEIVRIKND